MHAICAHFSDARDNKNIDLEAYLEVFALIETYIDAKEVSLDVPSLPDDRDQWQEIIIQFINETQRDLAKYIKTKIEMIDCIGNITITEYGSGITI